LMRGCRRLNDERLAISQIREVTDQFEVINEAAGVRFCSFQCEGENCTKSVSEVFLCKLVIRAAFESRIVHTFDQRMFFKPLRECKCIINRALYAKRKCFQSLQELERIERTQRWAEVTQSFNACADDVSDVRKI